MYFIPLAFHFPPDGPLQPAFREELPKIKNKLPTEKDMDVIKGIHVVSIYNINDFLFKCILC